MLYRTSLILICLSFFSTACSAQNIEPAKSGSELREYLRENYSPENSLSYSDAREEMFSKIDNEGGEVRLVYTGKQYQTSTTPNHQEVNTEHTWPQSKFRDGHRRWQMKSDLHHLYPTWSKVNSARGSFPFGEIPDTTTAKWWNSADFSEGIPRTDIDSYSESVSGVFEPREDHKGNVARSMFYFYTIYEERDINLTWFNPQIPTLLQWHFDDPVDEREKDRNEGIEDAQGNLNPFVLDESLAARIFREDGDDSPTPFAANADDGDAGIPGLRIQVHQHQHDDNAPRRDRNSSQRNQRSRDESRRGGRGGNRMRETERRSERDRRGIRQNERRRDQNASGETDTNQAGRQRENRKRELFPFEHMEKGVNAPQPQAPFAAAASGPDDGEIRIATFNIANFGARRSQEYERSLISLANTLLETNADLIALQEVEPSELGRKQVERLNELLNRAASFYGLESYQYAISDKDGGDELTAFLWRDPVVLDSSIASLPHDRDHDNDGKRSFQRVPQMAAFHAGNFDFVVVNCHLYTQPIGNSSEGRILENRMIAEWLEAVSESDEEQDVIVLGDLNRHLGNRGDEAWQELMYDGHEDHFRFPLLEAIVAEDSDSVSYTHLTLPTICSV